MLRLAFLDRLEARYDMARITQERDVVQVRMLEFDNSYHFRIEILREKTEQIGEVIYVSEVYQLLWPNGFLKIETAGVDSRSRQHWVFLEDFPEFRDSSMEELLIHTVEEVSRYVDTYKRDFMGNPRRAG